MIVTSELLRRAPVTESGRGRRFLMESLKTGQT